MLTPTRLLHLLSPNHSLQCGDIGETLCKDCRDLLWYPECCVGCKSMSNGYETCQKCKSRTSLHALICISDYAETARELVHKMKYGPSRTSAEAIARAMYEKAFSIEIPGLIVSYIPSSPERIRERGFDHARYIAQSYAKLSGFTLSKLLERTNRKHQVGASRKTRLTQMHDVFKAVEQIPENVLLIDDVYTTGATLESAAKALKKAGTKHVYGLVFARAL